MDTSLQRNAERIRYATTEFLLTHAIDGVRFPPIEGAQPNAMSTAEVVSVLSSTHPSCGSELIAGAVNYILRDQRHDGSWTDSNSDDPWEVAGTAWCVWALGHLDGVNTITALKKAKDYLVRLQLPDGGLPTNDACSEANTYATAYAARAFSLLCRSTEMERTISFLNRLQNQDGGWGLYMGQDSETTLTCYVIHGLLDCGLEPQNEMVKRGIAFLLQSRQKDGVWGSWLNENRSIEGTGFSLFLLARAGCPIGELEHKGIRFILDSLSAGTAFQIDGVNQIWIGPTLLLAARQLAMR